MGDGVFFASRFEDAHLAGLRNEVKRQCAHLGLSVWDAPSNLQGSSLSDILNECLKGIRDSGIFLCVLTDTYGESRQDYAQLCILEAEIFYALLTRKRAKIFALEPFQPVQFLATLVEFVETVSPNAVERCQRDHVADEIRRVLRRWKRRWASPFAARKGDDLPTLNSEDLVKLRFLNGRRFPLSPITEPTEEAIRGLIETAKRSDYLPTRLALLWGAMRQLSASNESDTAVQHLRSEVLSIWVTTSAWSGLHGRHLSLGTLAALDSIIAQATGLKGPVDVPPRQFCGALASEYYSMSKRVRSRRRRHELAREALRFVELALCENPQDPSGLLLIKGSVLLQLGHADDAVQSYEAALEHREAFGFPNPRIGEAEGELGYGYFRQGRWKEARVLLEQAVSLLECEKIPRFRVRAKKKLALVYGVRHPRLALTELTETTALIEEFGVDGQLNWPLRLVQVIKRRPILGKLLSVMLARRGAR